MFNESTQRRFWILESVECIQEAQIIANQTFVDKMRKMNSNQNIHSGEYLTHKEERLVLIYYTQYVYDICKKFKPPVPMSVIGTAVTYFKRFYLHTSVMEFHPNSVAFLCVYLACKVEEYTVSIDQFMGQVMSEPNPRMHMFIIDNELLLMQKLKFHLTVHSPYRPMEGLIIDLKTKQSDLGFENLEQYRSNAEKFLAMGLLTDICLLYTPSQIALAAVNFAVGKQFKNYVQSICSADTLAGVLSKLEKINNMVLNFRFPAEVEIKAIESKLQICRDPENDPMSEYYHDRDQTRKEAKERQKKRKYQELCDMQKEENKMLTYQSD